MKLHSSWLLVPIALMLPLAIPTAANGNPIQTPLSSAVVVTGSSGGSQSSQCGFVADTPNQVVRVTETFTPVRFRVQGEGELTLLITGPDSFTQCVIADSFSGGNIEVPGVLEQGTYSVYVGDRAQGNHPYTLSITQEN